jgi:hypothetical protein
MNAPQPGSGLFGLVSFGILLVILGYTVLTSTDTQKKFEADCAKLKGEVARQGGNLICVDPHYILKEQDDDGHHHH